MARVKESETVRDVVCGVGVPPPEAVAARAYRGETYYFCCPGCAQAFEADPEAYIAEAPIRGYRVEQKVKLGPDVERVKTAETEVRHYGPEIAQAEQRITRARDGLQRLGRELDDARSKLAQQRAQLKEAKQREAMPMPEETRVLDLERQVERERMELEAAERAMGEARKSAEATLETERGEIARLDERRRALEAEVQDLNGRVQRLESQARVTPAMREELEQARDRLGQLRQQLEAVGAEQGEVRSQLAEQRGVERGAAMPGEGGRATEEHVTAGTLEDLDATERALQADVATQATRVSDLEARIGAMADVQRELEDARARLMQRRDELEALGKHGDEVQKALGREQQQLVEKQRRVESERAELTAAQRATDEARRRAEQIARQRRAEIAELQRTEKGAKKGIETEAQRAHATEARISQLENEARDAERRAGELRDAQRRAESELDRIRRETREVVLVGLPAVAGEEPGEFYRAIPVREKRGR